MKAYYNEIDPFKAEVLRQAISAGSIAPGDVDERSIADVRADDLRGYNQCHFFAGGGFWSLALRQAGWRDDQPVWTGSCPCPSFSAAGKGEGFNDPRHLWPEWFRLIRECKPPVIFGEQVDAAIGHGWLDLVGMDVEGEGYAIASAVLPAASVGAPHRRNRIYFVANPLRSGQSRQGKLGRSGDTEARRNREEYRIEHDGQSCNVANTTERGLGIDGSASRERRHSTQSNGADRTGPTNGFWRDADWLGCRDGKWRPVESGTFPLANGDTARVGRLRMYGDAIVVPAAQAFIEAYLEI